MARKKKKQKRPPQPSRTRTPDVPPSREILSVGEVVVVTGLARQSIYTLIRKGEFPPGRSLGRRRLFLRSEIDDWMRGLEMAS